jgi:diacylglycerol kinase (ATP)
MKIAIIVNGISRNKKRFYHKLYPAISQEFDTTVLETKFAGHAEELGAQVVHEKYNVVMAAGGDGTLHQVTNGMLKCKKDELPILGVIPLGTGNDFARTCSLKAEASHVSGLLRTANPKLTDVGQIQCADKNGQAVTRYFINVCSLGMGPEVVTRLVKSNRAWGPDITYYSSIISAFFSQRPVEVSYSSDSSQWKGKARVIAIANGKSFGNELYVAPDAKVDDGLFSSFIAGEIPLFRFLMLLKMVKRSKKIVDPRIHYQTLTQVNLTSSRRCMLEGDGEIEGFLPATITILPKKISFLR